MTDLENAIASIEKLVTDYALGPRDEDPIEEIEQLIREVSSLAPKTTQVAALLSQIKHLAPVVFRLRTQERYAEIEPGQHRLLEDCERLREVVVPQTSDA